MSILDTFFILFEGDSEKAEAASKRAEHAGVQAAEHIEHGLHKVGEAAEEEEGKLALLAEHFEEMGHSAKRFLVGMLEAYATVEIFEKIKEGITETAEQMHKLGETSELLGVSVEQLDQWGQAVTRTGGNAETFGNTLTHIQGQLARMDLGGGARMKKIFENLGISAEEHGKLKSSFQLLEELQKKFEGMDKTKSAGIGKALGLDDSTIRLLQMGNKEFDELMEHVKKIGLATEESIKPSNEYIESTHDMEQASRNFWISLGEMVLPVLAEIMVALAEFSAFLSRHKPLILTFFAEIGTAAIILGAIFFASFGYIIAAVIAVVAALALVALAIDDVWTYMQGGKSVTAGVIEYILKEWSKLPSGIKAYLDYAFHIWKLFITDILALAKLISDLVFDPAHAMQHWKEFNATLKGAMDEFLAHLWDDLPLGLQNVLSIVGALFTGNFSKLSPQAQEFAKKLWASMPASVRLAWTAVYDLFTGNFDKLKKDAVEFGQELWREVLFAAGTLWDNLYSLFIGKFDEIRDEAIGFANRIWNALPAYLQDILKIVYDLFTMNFDDIWAIAIKWGNQIWELLPQALRDILTSLEKLWDDNFKYVTDGFNAVIEKLKGYWQSLVEYIRNNPITTFLSNLSGGKPDVPTHSFKPGRDPAALDRALEAPRPAGTPLPATTPPPPAGLSDDAIGPGAGMGAVHGDVLQGQAVLAGTQVAPGLTSGAPVTNISKPVNITQNNTATVTVQTGETDPQALAKAIDDKLNEHYEHTMLQYSTGIAN